MALLFECGGDGPSRESLRDGTHVNADHKIDGAPSVPFDAIALVLSPAGAEKLAGEATAKDFVSDAYSHCKFIGFTAPAMLLFDKSGLSKSVDAGFVPLGQGKGGNDFIATCRGVRLWAREPKVKMSR